MKRKSRVCAAGALAVLFAFVSIAEESERSALFAQAFELRRGGDVELDVPYVPTPESVVNEMLTLAGVTENDIVFDLGCGDGRIVVTAAAKYGAQGVGIDIDPNRIRESNENAARAGVSNRVRFIRQDLFEADLTGATVVTLYLLPDINLKLRPKLLEELQPGTRIVSHSFDMGEWRPERRQGIGRRNIFLWTVPVNASGRWEWIGEEGLGAGHWAVDIEQAYQRIAVSAHVDGAAVAVRNSALDGDAIRFTVLRRNGRDVVRTDFEGRLAGNAIQGRMQTANESAEWMAVREPGTMMPLHREDEGGEIVSAERQLGR